MACLTTSIAYIVQDILEVEDPEILQPLVDELVEKLDDESAVLNDVVMHAFRDYLECDDLPMLVDIFCDRFGLLSKRHKRRRLGKPHPSHTNFFVKDASYATHWTVATNPKTDNKLFDRYPQIHKHCRHGDLIQDTNSEMVYMLCRPNPQDSPIVMDLDYTHDDEMGAPPHMFSVITDYPLNYWLGPDNKASHLGGTPDIRWGGEYQYLHFDGDKLAELATNIEEDLDTQTLTFQCNDMHYSIRMVGDIDESLGLFQHFCEHELVGCIEDHCPTKGYVDYTIF